MKALIIAAGRGSSFRGQAPRSHKTLIPVCGLTVIERIVAACPQAEELVIVTGYQAQELEAKLTRILKGKIKFTFIRNPEWEKANGISVLAARDALSGEKAFLLSMSDHVYEPALVELLTAEPPCPGQCLLAVDRNLGACFDLNDATKVKLDGTGKIVNIGKQIADFNAVDTGVFYCTPSIFYALDEASSAGRESLSDGVRVLCRKGAMGYRDVTGAMWQDVDEPNSLAEAEKRLWRVAVKPRDGVVSRLFNRKVSALVTRLICGLPVRPNHVTLFNLFLAAAASLLIASGQFLAGGLAAQFYSIVDGVDGELARLKHQGSWFGGWLDNVTDRLCDWMLISAAAWSITRVGTGKETAWIFMAAALFSNILYWTAMDSLLVSGILRTPETKGNFLARVEKWFYEREMVFGLTHDSYLLILAVGVALKKPAATLAVLIVLETFWWAIKLIQVRKTRPSEKYAEFLARENAGKAQRAESAAL